MCIPFSQLYDFEDSDERNGIDTSPSKQFTMSGKHLTETSI